MINEALAELYAGWQAQHPGDHMVKCGVMDEQSYKIAKPRIAWLNKEVNDPECGRWDMVNQRGTGFLQKAVKAGLESKSFYHSAEQLGLWSYGILKKFPSIDKLQVNFSAAQGLSAVGWTNLKKSGGRSRADQREVGESANRQFELWSRELEIMDPELIVCGFGTQYRLYLVATELLRKKWYNLQTVRQVNVSSIGSSFPCFYSLWQINSHDCVMTNFYNPAARGTYRKYYLKLASIFDELQTRSLS